ncbi:MAG TPA: gamma-glutamyltransferase [Rhodanobacteraceae bacterium]|nr:gamma-glutamyltransferase [Rhodanobacteraceae bacterium]
MKSLRRALLILSVMLLGAAPALAATPAATTSPVAKVAQRPGHAAIASAHKLATEAGLEILREGGNAFDAAVAVASTLSVVEPQSSGIGGGGFFLLHRASDGKNVMLDARETAPSGSSSKLYEDANGNPDRDKSLNGALAAGIPGEPAALVWMAQHYGKLPLSKSLAPAIRIARNGFQPDARFLSELHERAKVIARYPGSAKLLLPDGKPPRAGWTFKNPDLADTLERIAKDGDAGFYRGEFAKKLVDGVRAAGGDWTLADLENYKVKERAPIAFDYRPPGKPAYHIVSASPPSSGGVVLEEMLNILSGFDLDKMDRAHRVHTIVEAMRRGYRDRTQYLGDPDFVQMPIARLTSMAYADKLRESIKPDEATPSSALPPADPTKPESMHTTHFSIVDKDGNMVSATQTVNTAFGSCLVIPGTGFVLNNEMDDFALVPGKPNAYGLIGYEANAPEPGHRPLSSMTPSFVFGPDRDMVIGTPGGSRIITMVLEGILSFVDGNDAAQITARPRFHHQYLPDVISAEPGALDPATIKALQAMGYTVNAGERRWGFMNVVIWNRKTGRLGAASDPRGDSGLGKVQ